MLLGNDPGQPELRLGTLAASDSSSKKVSEKCITLCTFVVSDQGAKGDRVLAIPHHQRGPGLRAQTRQARSLRALCLGQAAPAPVMPGWLLGEKHH